MMAFLNSLKARLDQLLARKYTFIFVPDVTGRFLRFSVPQSLVKGAGVLGTVTLVVFLYFSYSVLQKNSDLQQLTDLRTLTSEQKLEIQQFARKVKQIEGQLARLETFDRKLRVITALERQDTDASDFGAGGPSADAEFDFNSTSKRYTQSLLDALSADLDHLKAAAENQEASFFELDEFFKDQASLLSHTPSIWPVKGFITSTFGYRRSPFTNLREMHEGLDIATHLKSPVMAPADGIVIRSGLHRGYGNMVEMDHGYGVITRFGHNSKNLVAPGQKIKRGDIIALVGSTGRSTGPHLHYEVLLNGVPVNPYRYILED